MSHSLDVLQAFAVSSARLGIGAFTEGHRVKPEKPLELYEFEACPYCRKVRDALTTLDLDAVIYPCPKGGEVFRPKVKALGGKTQFPFLVDPNTGKQMYESDEIIAYLFRTYGKGKPGIRFSAPVNATSFLASAARPAQGRNKRPSKMPEKPLELYSFEASPFSRIVRETLSELEIPYLLHNVGKGKQVDWMPPPLRARLRPNDEMTTENRRAFVKRSGKMQVPFLIDPNTGVEMFESADIKAYLLKTYGR
jgi:glutathione S-transferase